MPGPITSSLSPEVFTVEGTLFQRFLLFALVPKITIAFLACHHASVHSKDISSLLEKNVWGT